MNKHQAETWPKQLRQSRILPGAHQSKVLKHPRSVKRRIRVELHRGKSLFVQLVEGATKKI
jgi:urease accessory protein UreE